LIGISLIRNGTFLIATTASTSLLGYLFWVASARVVEPAEVGFASAVISTAALASYVCTMGAETYVIQLLPTLHGRSWSEFLWRAMCWAGAISVSISLILTLVLPTLLSNFGALRHPSVGLAFCLITGLTSIAAVLDGALIALRRSGLQFTRNTSFGVSKFALLLLLWLATAHLSAAAILWAWAAGLVLSIGLGFRLLPQDNRWLPDIRALNPMPLWSSRRLLAGNLLNGIGAFLPMYVFPILVVGTLSATENAYFFFTWSISAVFFTISSAISQALLAENASTRDEWRQIKFAGAAIISLLVPVTFLASLFAPQLLGIFGAEYATHGVALLRLNAIAAYPDAITNVYVAVLLARRQPARAASLNLAMGLTAVLGAAVTLPLLGINAVAWSWMAAQVLGVVVIAFRFRAWRNSSRKGQEQLHEMTSAS